MLGPRTLAAILMVTVTVIVVAAMFSGSSEAQFASDGTLECPPSEEPRPQPPSDRTGDWLSSYRETAVEWQGDWERQAADYFIRARTSMVPARRASIEALEPIKRFQEVVAGADGVITGTVAGQRLGYYDAELGRSVGLVSRLDGGARVVHHISLSCSQPIVLAYFPLRPALQPGVRYALVVGPQQADGSREVLLAYNLDGIKVTQYWPTSESPIGGGSVISHLVDAIED
jgi:hypothetical protein